MPARRGWMDDVGRLCEMVRGLCPRDCIRWAVEGGGRTVSDVGAIGHAGRVRLTRPGGHANAGRRGRRPLRAAAKRRYQHRGKQMRKGENLLPRLGSPERGAVAALCAVTEGLVPAWVRRTDVTRHPTPGGRGGGVARGTDAVRRPTAANRGRCALRGEL